MTTAEGEQIAAARQDPARLRGIIGVQLGKVSGFALTADLDALNQIVDAQQALIDSFSAPMINDTLQENAA